MPPFEYTAVVSRIIMSGGLFMFIRNRNVSLVTAVLLLVSLPAVSADDAERLARLATGVERASALREIKRLQYTFNQYLDVGMWNELADLVTANATADFGAAKAKGKAELRKHYMDEAGRTANGLAGGQLNTHLIMQPIVNLGPDGKTAKGAWHELQMLGKYGDKALWVGGIYENDYALEDGKWKISNVHFYEQYRGLYEEPGQKGANVQVPYHFTGEHVGLTIPVSALQPDAAKADVATLTSRLQYMDDENAVRNLQHAYGYYLDRKMWDDVADLFTPDRAPQIRRDLESKYGPPKLKYGELFDHLNFGTVVSIAPDGQHAAARTTELAQIGLNNEYSRWELGVYENEFSKENGIWKINAIGYQPRMITDYEKGWAKDFRPAPKFSYPKFHNLKVAPAKPAAKSAIKTVAALETMLAQAIGVDAVENLNSSYGYYLDDGSWDDMANTFGLKGAKEITGAGVYEGSEKIRAILKLRGSQGVGRNPVSYTIHQLIQPVIHISADGSSANARLRLFQGGGRMDGSNSTWIGGIYENTAFFENGEWKFGRQDLHHMFNASYKNGWAKFAPRPAATPKPASPAKGKAPSLQSQIAPDRPIRAPQYRFPEITEPAFHYKNPVSGREPAELLP